MNLQRASAARGGAAAEVRYPSLAGRVVLVTGGSRGLGRAMALALAAQGARVAITGREDGAALGASAAALAERAGPGRTLAIVADVCSPPACAATVERVRAAFGRLDVLVNNAGLGMRSISESYMEEPPGFWTADLEAWRAIVDTNLNGAFYMARAAVPGMIAQGFGKLINISTSDGVLSRRGLAPYGPSKAALESMSQIWARDLEGTGVDVNVFLPGAATDTDILPDSRRAQGNMLPAEIMAPGILWLCADESNGRSGGRYVARLWDEALPPDEAAVQASRPLSLGCVPG
ncbi:MAG: SDR family oxidoreductase [Dongiaceae bacterium]